MMMTRAGKAVRAAAIVYTALLTLTSLLPSGTGPLKGWDASVSPDLQDALHLPAYGGLVVLWVLAWSTRFRASAAAVLLITLLCIAFGAAMDDDVNQIGHSLGYKHVSQFDDEFRDTFGLSPRAFRTTLRAVVRLC